MPCAAWLNVLGQFAATSGAASLMAQHVAAMWVMQNGYVFQQRELFLVYARNIPSNPSMHTCTSHHADGPV